jgi:FAD/FMN-containing dehydrogenase
MASNTAPDAASLHALADAAGPGNATTDAALLAPHLVDWRHKHFGQTPLMLMPRTLAQVVAIVEAAARHRVGLVPQGGNTGLVGGGIPPANGSAVLLSLKRINHIEPVDTGGQTLRAGAGAILAHVHEAAAAAGMAFPLSLGARGSATIGGLAATNAGGVQVLRHGTMRALVAGLRAVLPNGDILDQSAGLPKDNRGYDLKQLLIGSEGTLGIITDLTLKLIPAPAARIVAWAGVPSPHAALQLLARLRAASANQVESFELIPDTGLQLVLAHVPGTRPPLTTRHPWHVLIELAGPPSLETIMVETLDAALQAEEIGDAALAASTAQAAAFWHLRETLPEGERQDGPALHHDIAVPVAALPAFARSATARIEARFPGSRVLAFGHLGDGNLHFNVRAPAVPEAKAWTEQHGPAITRMVHDLVTEADGSLSAEHGIGTLKRDDLARLLPPARLAMMRSLKQALDPLGIMNPGKLL